MFFPVDMEDQEKIKWVDAVFKRKQEIESEITDIFGDKEAVKLFRYGNRVRLRFPCPEKSCSFSTVDMVKHLFRKHKWSKEETLLQTSYYHCLHDYITKMKTYFPNKPCLCFTCARVFDRIDCYISAKHGHRGLEEYYEILKKYRERCDELLFASRSFEKYTIHNLRSKIEEVKSFDYKDYVCHRDQATCSSTSLKEASGSSLFKSAATERAPAPHPTQQQQREHQAPHPTQQQQREYQAPNPTQQQKREDQAPHPMQ